MFYYKNYKLSYNIVYKDVLLNLHMKGGEKTQILSNKDSNISFYLYKIVE